MLRRAAAAAAGPRRVWRRTAAAAAPADSSGVWREGNAAGWSLGRAGVGAGVPPRRRGVGGVAAVQVSVLVVPAEFPRHGGSLPVPSGGSAATQSRGRQRRARQKSLLSYIAPPRFRSRKERCGGLCVSLLQQTGNNRQTSSTGPSERGVSEV